MRRGGTQTVTELLQGCVLISRPWRNVEIRRGGCLYTAKGQEDYYESGAFFSAADPVAHVWLYWSLSWRPFEVGDDLGGLHRPLRERGSLWTTCKRAASRQEGGQKNTESMA